MCNDTLGVGGFSGTWKALKNIMCVGHGQYAQEYYLIHQSSTQYSYSKRQVGHQVVLYT